MCKHKSALGTFGQDKTRALTFNSSWTSKKASPSKVNKEEDRLILSECSNFNVECLPLELFDIEILNFITCKQACLEVEFIQGF